MKNISAWIQTQLLTAHNSVLNGMCVQWCRVDARCAQATDCHHAEVSIPWSIPLPVSMPAICLALRTWCSMRSQTLPWHVNACKIKYAPRIISIAISNCRYTPICIIKCLRCQNTQSQQDSRGTTEETYKQMMCKMKINFENDLLVAFEKASTHIPVASSDFSQTVRTFFPRRATKCSEFFSFYVHSARLRSAWQTFFYTFHHSCVSCRSSFDIYLRKCDRTQLNWTSPSTIKNEYAFVCRYCNRPQGTKGTDLFGCT